VGSGGDTLSAFARGEFAGMDYFLTLLAATLQIAAHF
jgi:hypothetical protein